MHTNMTMEDIQALLEQSYTARREKKLMDAEEGKGTAAKHSRSFNIIQSDIYFAIKDAIEEFVNLKTTGRGPKMPFLKDVVIPYIKKYNEDADKYGIKNLQKSPASKIIAYFTSEAIAHYCIFEEKTKMNTAIGLMEELRFQMGDENCWDKEVPESYVIGALSILNIAVSSCDFLEEVGGTNAGNNAIPVTIQMTEEYAKKIGNIKEALKAVLSPMEPMVCKPVHHTNLVSKSGGYLTTPSPLLKNPIKVNGRIHQSILECNVKNNPDLFRILNKMQDTPYRVDKEFLDLIPSIFNYIEEVDDSDKGDKYDTSNRIVTYTIDMARTYSAYPEIYYPMFVDNRGRMYPYASNGLSYQSDDLGKSLVEYARGRKLNKDGVDALKFALGEYLGVAKVVGPNRMKVVEEALPGLLKQYENRDWSFIKGDDAPFGFISILKELHNYYKDPENYVSHKVLHNDACSSGLQLIGLFTQDKLNLKITNVLNPKEDKLEDLYLITAAANKQRILEKNEKRSENTEAYNTMLDIILEHKEILDDRAVVKTPSMTFYNYGAKQTSVYSNIVEKMWSKYNSVLLQMVGEEIDDIKMLFMGNGTLKSGKYPVVAAFCQNVWDSMQSANPTAVAAQKWMGELIKHDIKQQDCFSFINPLTGFPVVLRKPEYASEEVRSTSIVPVKDGDKTKWVRKGIHHRMYRPTNKIKTTKTVTSSIPGIIHAADAGVMVLICDKLGYITGIHDSAGCHPNDVPELRKCVALTLYECATCDYYQKLKEQCDFNVEPPLVNTLEDVEIIKETLYAFA